MSGVLAAFVALLLYNVVAPGPPPLTPRDVNDTVAQMLASATPAPAYSALAYRAIQPSLVLIQTQFTDANGAVEDGLGSGVIVDDRGDILTSLHVVANANEIQITFADGTQSSAEVAASQPENDIAVLRASRLPEQLIPATLGNPGAMHIGDEAFVVGHPLGLYGSMSVGVISGLDRSFQPPGDAPQLQGLIQIDAAVNPATQADRCSIAMARWLASSPGWSTRPSKMSLSASGSPCQSMSRAARPACRRTRMIKVAC